MGNGKYREKVKDIRREWEGRERKIKKESEKEIQRERESAINANYLQTYGKIIIMM